VTPAQDLIGRAKEAQIDNPRDGKALLAIETIYQTLAVADNVDAAATLSVWS